MVIVDKFDPNRKLIGRSISFYWKQNILMSHIHTHAFRITSILCPSILKMFWLVICGACVVCRQGHSKIYVQWMVCEEETHQDPVFIPSTAPLHHRINHYCIHSVCPVLWTLPQPNTGDLWPFCQQALLLFPLSHTHTLTPLVVFGPSGHTTANQSTVAVLQWLHIIS